MEVGVLTTGDVVGMRPLWMIEGMGTPAITQWRGSNELNERGKKEWCENAPKNVDYRKQVGVQREVRRIKSTLHIVFS